MTAATASFRHRSRLAPLLEAWSGLTAFLDVGVGAVLDLAIRFWLAKIFFVSGMLKIVNWDVTIFLYANEHPVPGIDAATAALIGTGIELLCPIFLVFGIGTRFAAIPMFLTAAFLQFSYKELTDHALWMVLLTFLILRGPGALSLDYFIAKHLERSAIPFSRSLYRTTVFLARYILPPFALAVRLWLAWLLWSAAFAPGSPAWQAVGFILCAFLALGFATRPAALILAGLIPLMPVDIVHLGEPMLRFFLLASFVVHGAGALSLDRLLYLKGQRLCPSLSDDLGWLADAPRVVIVGAGFGGIAAAFKLRHAWARITLIDQRNYHLFQPLLYQVATATLSPADIAVPIRSMLRGQQNCRVLMGQVTGVATDRREVLVGDMRLPYDYLVLATGARHSYCGKDAWETFAPGLKKIEDATGVRGRILAAFEKAEACDDEAERRRLLTFVLVGGGPTGVELAGAIAELAHQGLREEFRTIDPSTARVILVQSGPLILPAFPKTLSLAATRSLSELGVEVMTHARVGGIDADGVQIGDTRIEARTVLWTAGVMASPAGKWIEAERDHAGRIVVGPDLAVSGVTDIFAIGDTAASKNTDGKPLPGLAAVAKQQGEYVGKLIRARIEDRRPLGPFHYHDYGSMATIGRKAAVADLQFVKLSGSLAWWLWGLVHVALLVDTRSRIAVMFDWFWSYLTYNRSMRLITGGENRAD